MEIFPPISNATPKQKPGTVVFGQEEGGALLAEWQAVLKLGAWDVNLRIARGNGLDMPKETQGRCQWTLSRHEAFIRIMDPQDWDHDICWPQDMERCLVHELLHLHFAPFDNFKEDSPENTALEQAIHAISGALVAVKRSRN